tara:strand:+ start:3042 stop:6971 length:3930 start_codon:yes stop_codon:yes gene_type:complete
MTSTNPRVGSGGINSAYKSSIQTRLYSLREEVKKSEKDVKKIDKLKDKAKAEIKKTKIVKEKKEIKNKLEKEIDRRQKKLDTDFDKLNDYREKVAQTTKKSGIGLSLTASDKVYLSDILTKGGRTSYLSNIGNSTFSNLPKERVKTIDKRLDTAATLYRRKKERGRFTKHPPRKTTRKMFHDGVKVEYYFDWSSKDDQNPIIDMIANVRKGWNATRYAHPNSKMTIMFKNDDVGGYDSEGKYEYVGWSLPGFQNYTLNDALELFEDKMEAYLMKYDEDDTRLDITEIVFSYLVEPNKIMGSGGHKTIQQASKDWFICDTSSKTNCFYRSIAFIRLMRDLDKDVERAKIVLSDDKMMTTLINNRAKMMKLSLSKISNLSRKTATEEDIQTYVDNCYGTGGKGSQNKCFVVIYNSVFNKVGTFMPKNYTKGVLKPIEIWNINHHFIPLVRWSELTNIRELCEDKTLRDKIEVENKEDSNEKIKDKRMYEIADEGMFREYLASEFLEYDEMKKGEISYWTRKYCSAYRNDPEKVCKKLSYKNNKIAVYDFEATPNGNKNIFKTYRVSFAYNVLDDKGKYIKMECKTFGGIDCIRKWMEYLYLNREKFCSYTLYAHNAGKFDLLLILSEYLLENKEYWTIDTGSSLIVLNGAYLNLMIYREEESEEGEKEMFSMVFRDSYRLLPGSLDKLCSEFNVPHKKLTGSVDFNEMNITNCYGGTVDAPNSEVFKSDLFRLELANTVYCNWDCYGLLEVMNIFKDEVYENMGSINITDCLTGASLSKKNYFLNYYDPSDKPIYSMKEEFDTFCRNGYYGGRNEAFFIGEYEGKVYYNDFTSLYPDVGRLRLPYGSPDKIQDSSINRLNRYMKSKKKLPPLVAMVRCMVRTKNFDAIPIHGIKKDHKLLFPHFEEWTELTLWFNEIRYGLSTDAYEYEFLDGIQFGKQSGSYYRNVENSEEKFWSKGMLHDFFNEGFEKKGKAKSEGKLALAQVYKIIINSGYGFWGLNALGDNKEGRDGIEILEKDDDSFWDLLNKGYISNMNTIGDYTICRTSKPMPITDYNVAIAAAICSEARMKLHKYMSAIRKYGGNLLYCDTDSCICDLDITKYPEIMKEFCWDGIDDIDKCGDELGSMKNEAVEKLEKYFLGKVMKEFPTLDNKKIIKGKVKDHMIKQRDNDGGNDFYFDKAIIAGCKQYCLHKKTYDGGYIEASASKGVCKKLYYKDFHHLLHGSDIEEQRAFEESIKEKKPEWIPREGYRIYETQHQFRSSLINHIDGNYDITKVSVDKCMRINYLKGIVNGSETRIDGIENKGYVLPLRL